MPEPTQIPRRPPLHRDRLEAFERVRRAVASGTSTFAIDHGENRRTSDRAAEIVRALESDKTATVRRGGGADATRVLVTMAGRRLAVARDAGGVALFPLDGPMRVVDRPQRWDADVDLARQDRRGLVRAMAPDEYDDDTRAGSAVTVVLDPVVDWLTHPVYEARRHSAGDAIRVWEVFTLDGESHGLLLMMENGFHGVEPCGAVSPEVSPGAAAWQIVMNG
ncbi:hypothetical protein ACXR8U_27115 [Methylobacterium radiotolerans]|jgi:hypothetical protein|uniref:hypothetical protein n=1 Tax=Methylobacterium TaxID=407 RepID=UPI0007510F3A|nr:MULTISPECIES: hypothetical protein [Methylobacterium]MBN6819211.1 hypothetical protein [Methylobacterium organophilum]OXE40581.1 hypothetical protein CCS92_19105 [Methylobacterium radiotolerans]